MCPIIAHTERKLHEITRSSIAKYITVVELSLLHDFINRHLFRTKRSDIVEYVANRMISYALETTGHFVSNCIGAAATKQRSVAPLYPVIVV